MPTKTNREAADDARAAAASSNLANVRDRNLRSAEAYAALADREEFVAAKARARIAEAADRLAGTATQDQS